MKTALLLMAITLMGCGKADPALSWANSQKLILGLEWAGQTFQLGVTESTDSTTHALQQATFGACMRDAIISRYEHDAYYADPAIAQTLNTDGTVKACVDLTNSHGV